METLAPAAVKALQTVNELLIKKSNESEFHTASYLLRISDVIESTIETLEELY
jgi:hypothetical protein